MNREYDDPGQRRIDVILRLNRMNKQLASAFVLFGATCEQASKAFRDLGKAGAYLKPVMRKVRWSQKTRPWS